MDSAYEIVAALGAEKNPQLQYMSSSDMMEANHHKVYHAIDALSDIKTILSLQNAGSASLSDELMDIIADKKHDLVELALEQIIPKW